ncbi:MAG: hypothetical protein RL479_1910 [Verrucomicrobiota bacterium]
MISLHEGKGARTKRSRDRALLLHLELTGAQPRVWRRLLVRESMWLSRFHEAIQVAFDWFDYQTHSFQFDDLRYGNPLQREDLMVEDDRDVTLATVDLEHRQRGVYQYHFGPGWQVELRLEGVQPLAKGKVYPVCVGGERAGPPEDCGGLDAFHDMLACIQEPHTELGREWLEWLGPEYDPAVCNVEGINKGLRKIGR